MECRLPVHRADRRHRARRAGRGRVVPLVVVSHGIGGSHLLYRALAAHLARNGFVVTLPEHPQNNRNDNELSGTAANLAQRPRPVEVTPDDRVAALVLLTPATARYLHDHALDVVDAPILMLTAEHDEYTPPWHSEVVKRGVASPVTHRVVPGAGHYSFLTPFPEHMVSPASPPSQDPGGFDRKGFHAELNAEVLAFLGRLR